VVPELVSETKAFIPAEDLDSTYTDTKGKIVHITKAPKPKDPSDKSDTLTSYKSINYIGLIPVLISAIQEQQKEIDCLKLRLGYKKDAKAQCAE
jgi:hypothetical protein